ncbi:hypothetical protein ANANG_G00317340, partial [Anguilla anguilla]
ACEREPNATLWSFLQWRQKLKSRKPRQRPAPNVVSFSACQEKHWTAHFENLGIYRGVLKDVESLIFLQLSTFNVSTSKGRMFMLVEGTMMFKNVV